MGVLYLLEPVHSFVNFRDFELLQEFPRSEKTASKVSRTEKVRCHHTEVLAGRPSKETLPAGNLTNNITTKSGNFQELLRIMNYFYK
jgi:hypothetical protein